MSQLAPGSAGVIPRGDELRLVAFMQLKSHAGRESGAAVHVLLANAHK